MSTKRSRVRQWISVLLIVGMLVTALPTVAYADTEGSSPAQTTPTTVTNTRSFDAVQSAIVRKGANANKHQTLDNGRILLKNNNSNGNNTREGFIQFDLCDGNYNANDITQVELVLYALQQGADRPGKVKLKVTAVSSENKGEGWDAETIKASDAPALKEALGTSIQIGTQYTEYKFDVTSYVKSKIASANETYKGKVSFFLSSPEYDSRGTIYVPTEQYSNANYRPKLVVTQNTTDNTLPDIDFEPASDAEYLAIEKKWKDSEKTKSIHRSTMKGSGTVSDPYLIYTAEDLMSMAENDNSCYKLMRDIDLKGISWRPVGYYYWYPFMGYLDGNGHKITNLYVGGTSNDAWEINAGGLFGYFEGRVENLGVETVKAERKGIDFFGTAGGIAGVTNAPAEIINCYFNGYVAGAGYAGGLVGISYPGTVIENCCAFGTVDMSQSFEYLNDNEVQWLYDIYNAVMDVAIWTAGVVTDVAQLIATGDASEIWSIVKDVLTAPSDLKSLYNTGYIESIRRCSIGGLVGLNYGRINNSYASNKLYNIDAGYNSYKTKVGPITGRNMENDGAEVRMCYFNSDIDNDIDNSAPFSDCGKDTATIKNGSTLKSELKSQWNFSTKALSNKSTGGFPLPKINKVIRNMRTVGGKTYQPEVYYQSRVLMKTRENFIIGDEVSYEKTTNNKTVKTTAIRCTVCANLPSNDKSRAVTGLYQRGTVSQPYHVHDIDSLLAMQDNKESHFILCSDIDLKVTDGTNTVQKYWWPAGKTHFSPIKGSLKGNVSINQNRISITKKAKPTANASDVFTIKNLTVQHDKHAGLFASLRGTVSDVNIELTSDNPHDNSDDWKTWRDGIKGYAPNKGKPTIVGISTMGPKASAGAIAGETVTGALIRDCNVGGKGCGDNKSENEAKEEDRKNPYEIGDYYGVVKGSLRAGGIVGLLNRGAKIKGCRAYTWADVNNFDIHFGEDSFKEWMDVIAPVGLTAAAVGDAVVNFTEFLDLWQCFEKYASGQGTKTDNMSLRKSYLNLGNEDVSSLSTGKYYAKTCFKVTNIFFQGLSSICSPLLNLWADKYSKACAGRFVGESYGTISGCRIYDTPEYLWGAWWCFTDGDVIGYLGREQVSSIDKDKLFKAQETPSEEFGFSLIDFDYVRTMEQLYLEQNNNVVCSIASTKVGIRGKGTEEEPIKVRTEADLRKIASMLAEGYTFEGDYIEQTDNIKLTGDFECMGLSSGTPFKGVYNGNECRIENLNITGSETAALFYKLDGACVYDLSIVNGQFTAPNATSLASEATGESLILNCSSDSEIIAIGDEQHAAAAGGLVLTLDNSYIGNSYAAGTISSETDAVAGGLAYNVQGTSELANCYSAVTMEGEGITGYGIAASVQDKASGGDCVMYNCYWPYDNIIKQHSPSGNRYWSHVCRKASGMNGYDRSYMQSQDLVNYLNGGKNECVHNKCYISMSDNREWVQTKAGEYPAFKVNKCSLNVVQPEFGEIIAERVLESSGEKIYTRIDEPMIPINSNVRFILKNLPDDKEVDYWTLNGERFSDAGRMTSFRQKIDKDSVIGVVLKDGVPLADQTRKVDVKAPQDGTLWLQIIDEYDTANPSCEVGIRSLTIIGENGQKTSVNEEDLGTCVFENDVISIRMKDYSEGIFEITIPYGAMVVLSYAINDPYEFDNITITKGTEKTYVRKKDFDSSNRYEFFVREECSLEMILNQMSSEESSVIIIR